MYCFFCGREIKGTVKFCPYCGKSCDISSSSSEVNAVGVDDDWYDAPIDTNHGLSKVLRVLIPVCAVAAILAIVGIFVVPKIIGNNNDIEVDNAEEYEEHVHKTEQALEATELDVLQIYKDAASSMEGQNFSFYEKCSYNNYIGSDMADDSVIVSSVSVVNIVDNNESTMRIFGTYSGSMAYSDDLEDAIAYNFYYADGVYYTSDTTSDEYVADDDSQDPFRLISQYIFGIEEGDVISVSAVDSTYTLAVDGAIALDQNELAMYLVESMTEDGYNADFTCDTLTIEFSVNDDGTFSSIHISFDVDMVAEDIAEEGVTMSCDSVFEFSNYGDMEVSEPKGLNSVQDELTDSDETENADELEDSNELENVDESESDEETKRTNEAEATEQVTQVTDVREPQNTAETESNTNDKTATEDTVTETPFVDEKDNDLSTAAPEPITPEPITPEPVTIEEDDENEADSVQTDDKDDDVTDQNTVETTKYAVGIIQTMENTSLDEAVQGFEDVLTELLGEDNVVFNLRNVQDGADAISTTADDLVSEEVDLILANGTASLQAVVEATNSIPILGTSITDYITALNIDEWTGVTGINVSGTSDLAPLEEQANMIAELCPAEEYPTVGILYCSSERNAIYQADVITDYLMDLGYTVVEYTFDDTDSVSTITQEACDSCDVLYIPCDDVADTCSEDIYSITSEADVPIIAGSESIMVGCGVASLSVSYYDIGYITGQMAYEILVNGADIGSMEILYTSDVTRIYVADRCEELGITVTDQYVPYEVTEELS